MKIPARKNSTVSQLFGNPKKGKIATKAPESIMSASKVMEEIYHTVSS